MSVWFGSQAIAPRDEAGAGSGWASDRGSSDRRHGPDCHAVGAPDDGPGAIDAIGEDVGGRPVAHPGDHRPDRGVSRVTQISPLGVIEKSPPPGC